MSADANTPVSASAAAALVSTDANTAEPADVPASVATVRGDEALSVMLLDLQQLWNWCCPTCNVYVTLD